MAVVDDGEDGMSDNSRIEAAIGAFRRTFTREKCDVTAITAALAAADAVAPDAAHNAALEAAALLADQANQYCLGAAIRGLRR